MPTEGPTISALAARAVVLAAAERGVPPAELCARFGLDPEALADVDGRVPALVMRDMWEGIEELAGDPSFGLHLGESTAAIGPSLPWHLMRASATVGEGLERIVALWRLFNDVHPPRYEVSGDEVVLAMPTKDSPLPVPRHAVEFAFVWFVETARRATGVPFRAKSVAFEHPAPAETSEHARIFDCRVDFDAGAAALVFSRADLATPTRTPEPELVELLQRAAQAQLDKLPARDLVPRVREAMTPLLPSADVTIPRVAAVLGQSPRTLQRKLHEEGTSFQRVLDDLRKDLAVRHLTAREMSIAEIGFLLGFSDQTTFHRAFVRWTGRTPGDVRGR